MKMRFYSAGLVAAFLSILIIPITASARGFSDVGTDFWAKDVIMEMSDKNIVVGYTDGSFKPDKEIKKVEALILLSRIVGVNSEENKDIVEKAELDYKDQLAQYNTYATREITYLLYKNIVKQNELDMFLGDVNDEKSILRYQVVPLIIRIMGKEEELAGKDTALLTYKDAETIPQEIRTYVEYLGEVGLMGTATEDNKFMPNKPMTRAQIAMLASRIIKKQEQENFQGSVGKLNNKDKTIVGVIKKIDVGNNIIYVNVNDETLSYDISNVKITRNNLQTNIRNINKEDNIIIFLEYNVVKKIHLSSIQKYLEGNINEIVISKSPRISIINSKGMTETFNLNQAVKITTLNKERNIYGLRLEDKVLVTLDKNEAVEIIVYQQ